MSKTVSVQDLLRDDLRGRTPYGAPQLDVAVRLNTNENPHPPSAALVEELSSRVAEAARTMNRYPDREATALRTELAAYLTRTAGEPIETAQVWAANGSNEIIQQLLQAFGGAGRTALGFEPTYSMHALICQSTGTTYLPTQRLPGFRLEATSAALVVHEHQPDIVFICSPNNPSGTALDPGVIEAVYDAAPGLVIVDEAYAEFSHRPSSIALLPGRERLVVTRTMSKAFAFAGGRLGYLAASPALVDALRVVRLPYHLSTLTQAVARAALANAGDLLARVGDLRRQRDLTVDSLRRRGLEVADSDANFVLFGRFPDRHRVWQGLLDEGVLIREVGPEGWLRVSIGTSAEMAAFEDALGAVLDHELVLAATDRGDS
jgi:histidinol-phosphate aminotransferase